MAALITPAYATAFLYQGKLNDGDAPAQGSYDVTFTLFDTETDGNAVATLTNSFTVITNGTFTALLDYGPNIFTGPNYWMELGVRTNGGTGFEVLAPRQIIAAVPYAIHAATAGRANVSVVAESVISVPTTNITGTIADAQLSTNVALLDGSPAFSGTVKAVEFVGSGMGLTNVPGTLKWRFVTETNQAAAVNSGYVFTNSSGIRFTLPSEATPGDVVNICSAGTGGWKIVQTNNQSIVSPKGLYSRVWTTNNLYQTWTALACSADGNRVLIASSSYYGGNILISGDSGFTWRTNTFAYATAATMSADGSKMVVTSSQTYGGGIYVSIDFGNSWSTYSNPGPNAYPVGKLALSGDGTKLFGATSQYVYYSPNLGMDWIARSSGSYVPVGASGLACSKDGLTVLAAVNGPLYISANAGLSWMNSNVQVASSVACSSDGSKIIIASSNGIIATSNNRGATWSNYPTSRVYGKIVASSADGLKLFTCASGSPIYASVDGGMSWEVEPISERYLSGLACSADGARLYAIAGQSRSLYIGQSVTRSSTTPGANGSLSGPANSTIGLLYVGAGKWTVINSSSDVLAN